MTPPTPNSDKRSVDREPDAELLDAEETEDLLEEAEDAVTEMEAREMRRDQKYRTGGDDYNPGIDTKIDGNAPKDEQE